MIGCAQDGTAWTVKTASSTSMGSTDIASTDIDCEVPGSDREVPEIGCEVPEIPGLLPSSTSIGTTSGSGFAGINIDSDSRDGLIDGFRRCSSDMPDGIAWRDEPILDSMSAASFSARGT